MKEITSRPSPTHVSHTATYPYLRCIPSPACPTHPLDHPLSAIDVCGRCDHVIASHYYSFTVSHLSLVADASLHSSPHPPTSSSHRVQQDYLMDCALCGRAVDSSHTLNDVTLDGSTRSQLFLSPSHSPLPPHSTTIHLMTATLLAVRHQPIQPHTSQVDVEDDEWD